MILIENSFESIAAEQALAITRKVRCPRCHSRMLTFHDDLLVKWFLLPMDEWPAPDQDDCYRSAAELLHNNSERGAYVLCMICQADIRVTVPYGLLVLLELEADASASEHLAKLARSDAL